MEIFYLKILEKQIKRLNKAMKKLEGMNILDNNCISTKKDMQKRVVKGYGLLVDIKMDLENLIKKMEE